jgi:hypothetical protein
VKDWAKQNAWGWAATSASPNVYVTDVSYSGSVNGVWPLNPPIAPVEARKRSATEWLRDQIAEITELAVA